MSTISQNLDMEEVLEAVQADDTSGFCVACGNHQYGCEPDMRKGKCEECGAFAVHGAEELLLYMA